MKSIMILCLLLLCFGTASVCHAEETGKRKIRLLFADQQAVVVLDDHPAAEDFVSMLPLTATFEDFNRIEKIAYLPRKLQTQGSPSSCDPSAGTFAYYAPWGNLAVFCHDFRYSNGLVPLGHVESGLENLAQMQGDFSVRLELCP